MSELVDFLVYPADASVESWAREELWQQLETEFESYYKLQEEHTLVISQA